MKKTLRLLGITAIAAIIGFGFASCEGPAGLQGPGGGTGAAALVRVEVGGNAVAAGALDYVGDASYLINFGSTLVPAEFADSRNLTITNTGTATLPITVHAVGAFGVEDEPFTLAPNASRTIIVTRPSVNTTVAQSHQSTITLSSTVTGFDDIEIMARFWVGPDTAALSARIQEANDLLAEIEVNTVAANGPVGTYWATALLRDAVIAARDNGVNLTVNADTAQAVVDPLVAALATANGDLSAGRQAGAQGVIVVTPVAPLAWAITSLVTATTGTVNLATTTSTATFSVPAALTTAGVTSAAPATATAAVAAGVLTITGVAAGDTTVTIALANHQSFTITVNVPGVTLTALPVTNPSPAFEAGSTPTAGTVNLATTTGTATFTVPAGTTVTPNVAGEDYATASIDGTTLTVIGVAEGNRTVTLTHAAHLDFVITVVVE